MTAHVIVLTTHMIVLATHIIVLTTHMSDLTSYSLLPTSGWLVLQLHDHKNIGLSILYYQIWLTSSRTRFEQVLFREQFSELKDA